MPLTKPGNMTWIKKLKKRNHGRGIREPKTKTRKIKQSLLTVRTEIDNWWKRRLDEKEVFECYMDFREGRDIVGQMPWPDAVSLHALHSDFQTATGVYLSRASFAYYWHKASGIRRGESKPFRILDEDGHTLMYTSRTMYDISGCIRRES